MHDVVAARRSATAEASRRFLYDVGLAVPLAAATRQHLARRDESRRWRALGWTSLASGGIASATSCSGDFVGSSVTGSRRRRRGHGAGAQTAALQENRDAARPPYAVAHPRASRTAGGRDYGRIHRRWLGSRSTEPPIFGRPRSRCDVATGDTTGALSSSRLAPVAGPGCPGSVRYSGRLGRNARSSLTKYTASSSLELSTPDATLDRGFGALSQIRAETPPRSSGLELGGLRRRSSRTRRGDRRRARGNGGDASARVDRRVRRAMVTKSPIGSDAPVRTVSPSSRWHDGGDVSCLDCAAGSISQGGERPSRSIGTAAGDSLVTVFDLAIGGSSAGWSNLRSAVRGPGGDASSAARGDPGRRRLPVEAKSGARRTRRPAASEDAAGRRRHVDASRPGERVEAWAARPAAEAAGVPRSQRLRDRACDRRRRDRFRARRSDHGYRRSAASCARRARRRSARSTTSRPRRLTAPRSRARRPIPGSRAARSSRALPLQRTSRPRSRVTPRFELFAGAEACSRSRTGRPLGRLARSGSPPISRSS